MAQNTHSAARMAESRAPCDRNIILLHEEGLLGKEALAKSASLENIQVRIALPWPIRAQ